MRRYITGSHTPLHHPILSKAIKRAGINVILCVGHIYIFRYGIYRHTIWFLYLFIGTVGNEISRKYFPVFYVDNGVCHFIGHRDMAPCYTHDI